MDIEKVNEFSFLKVEVEEFRSRVSVNLINARCVGYLKKKKKTLIFFMRHNHIIYSVFHSTMAMCCSSELSIFIYAPSF